MINPIISSAKIPENHSELVLCAHILFYLKGGLRKDFRGVTEFLKFGHTELGDQIKGMFNEFTARYDKDGHLKFSPFSTHKLKTVFNDLRLEGRKPYSLSLETSDSLYGVSDHALQIFDDGYDNAYLRYVFPAVSLTKNYKEYLERSNWIASKLNLRSGYLGFAVNQMYGTATVMTFKNSPLSKLAKKYFNVDLRTEWDSFGQFEQFGHTNLSWVTYFAGKFPTIKLPKGTKLFKCGKSWAFEIGDKPILGNSKEGKALSLYKLCAAKLDTLFAPSEIYGNYDLIGGTKTTQKWINRFRDG